MLTELSVICRVKLCHSTINHVCVFFSVKGDYTRYHNKRTSSESFLFRFRTALAAELRRPLVYKTHTHQCCIRAACTDQGCSQDVKSQDRDETETFHFPKLSRPRRLTFKTETRPRRSKKRIKTAVSQFKNTTWLSLSLDNLFLAGQIHYFLPDISASLMHCMDVHKTKVTRPRCYIFKTETFQKRL